jgi:hypothetical protein
MTRTPLTTTAAQSAGMTLTILRTDAHGETFRLTGRVEIADGYGILRVAPGTLSEYSVTLGGVHTPFPHM